MRTARTIADDVGYYHVILKATGPQFLFREDADKATFQDILKRVSRFSSVQPLAYAFLDNHMHLLLKVPERRSVPDDDFARRVAALYGPDRAAALFARWEKWRAQGREAETGGDGALPSGLAGAVAAYCQSPLSVAENSS